MEVRKKVGCAVKGLALVLVLLIAAGVWGWKGLYPFLAVRDPAASEVLVVEGWITDPLLEQVVEWGKSNGVKTVYTTGGPLETGSYLVEWKTHAEMTAARLKAMGAEKDFRVVAVPAKAVRKGRTVESARALKAVWPKGTVAFTLASEGPHTRRSQLAFQTVFGEGVEAGAWALTPVEYDGTDWWRCSEGVRSVMAESLSLMYEYAARVRSGPPGPE